MIFLTGDVHHKSMGGHDQKLLDCTEVEAAIKYVDIIADYGLKITLFLTGRCFIEEPQNVKQLINRKNVEIGGHTWNAFRFENLHKLSELLIGSYYGPKLYQQWDIKKTLNIIQEHTGKKCLSWRGHDYRGDAITNHVLSQNGIKLVSNKIDPHARIERLDNDIILLPINTLTDELNIARGDFTEQKMLDRLELVRREGDLFVYYVTSSRSRSKWKNNLLDGIKKIRDTKRMERRFMTEKQWLERLKKNIKKNIYRSGFATIQAHPANMALDSFRTFAQLCQFLGEDKKYRKTVYFVSDLLKEN